MSEPGFATIISYYFGALKNVMLALTSIAEPFFYIGFYYYMHLICQQPSFVYDATKIFKLLPIHYLLRFFFLLVLIFSLIFSSCFIQPESMQYKEVHIPLKLFIERY